MLLMMITIGERLRDLIASSGLTAYRVAADSGVPRSNLSDYLNGKKFPSDDVLAKLAPVLGVPLEQLQAWADAERLGAERLDGIEKYVLMRGARPAFGVVNDDGETEYPPTDWELELRAKAERLGLSFDLFTRPGFWQKPPEERRPLFRDLEGIIRDVQALMGEEHA